MIVAANLSCNSREEGEHNFYLKYKAYKFMYNVHVKNTEALNNCMTHD